MSETSSFPIGRASFRDISLYAPDRTPCAIDLSDNTNLWGVPPNAGAVLRGLASASLTRYPELYAASLKEALSGYVGADTECIVTGCGSDDILDSAIRAFAEPGAQLTAPDPSFAMIPIFARMNGLSVSLVQMTPRYEVDVDLMLAGDPAIVYLCSPNNPTGGALPRAVIEEIVARATGVVIVDEAYIEFAERSVALLAGADRGGDRAMSVVDLVKRHERLLVVRTMSKAFGLAGLRVGYAVGAPALVAEVEKSRGPYKVNGAAAEAARAALTLDLDWVAERAHEAVVNRNRLQHELALLGIPALPSSANFVLVPVRGAPAIAAALRKRGVALRPFDALPLVSDALAASGGQALRISVGPWDMMAAALDALREVLDQCA